MWQIAAGKPPEQFSRSAVTKMQRAPRALLPHNLSQERPSSDRPHPPRRNRHALASYNEASASDAVLMLPSDMALATPPELPDSQVIDIPQPGRPHGTIKEALQYNAYSGTWN